MEKNIINKFFHKVLQGSEFKKNLLTLMSGTAIAQLIPILCAPLLTRLFSPDEFGVYENFMAITAIITIFISGKYELAIILPKRNQEAINVLSLSCILALSFSLILLFLFLIFEKPISSFLSSILNGGDFQNVLWLVPMSAFLATIYLVFNEWCIRKKSFIILSKNKITNTSGITGGSLLFGFTKTSSGLIFGQIIGQLISSSLAIYRVLKEDLYLFKYVTIRKMKYFSRRYLDFAKYNIPGQFLNTLAGRLPIFFITMEFGIHEVGLFALTDRVLGVPLSFLGNTFKDVFKQRATHDYNNTGNCLAIYRKTTLTLLKIVIIPFIILFIIAPSLFSFIFGAEWYVAGEYARLLCVMYMISFISMPTSWIFIIAEKQKLDLFWQSLFLLLTLTSLIIGMVLDDIKATLILFCIGRSLAYLIQIGLTYRLAKGKK
ncbi:MAG: oligosaccharide flippase family protein [Bacteroidales bacterium]|nr:oligosaccharide flippase family protein [Bacteroidales bacterium]